MKYFLQPLSSFRWFKKGDKRNYVHEVLVNHLVKLAEGKVWLC